MSQLKEFTSIIPENYLLQTAEAILPLILQLNHHDKEYTMSDYCTNFYRIRES